MIRNMIYAVTKTLQKLRTRAAATMSLACISVLCLILVFASLYHVTVNDGGKSTSFISTKTETEAILASAGIDYVSSDVVNTEKDGNSIDITVDRAFTVTVTVGDESKSVLTQDCTVAEVINLAGIELSEHDLVSPAVDTLLTDTAYVDIVDIEYTTKRTEESIPYSTKTVKSSKLLSGTQKVTGGTNGVKVLTYKSKVVNGVVTETECIAEDVIKEPVDKVITVGTGKITSTTGISNADKWISELTPKNEILLDKNGVPLNYKKKLTGTATAYHGDSSTSTGVKPKPGYIAVNPEVIPYGTKMYIRSTDGKYIYGYAIAADTGGACRQNKIIADLYFPTVSSMNAFGRRNIEIYILE